MDGKGGVKKENIIKRRQIKWGRRRNRDSGQEEGKSEPEEKKK